MQAARGAPPGPAGAAAPRPDALRAAFAALRERRFADALHHAAPWAGDPDGGLLHALALAGTGAVAAAAPLLDAIARAHHGRPHPLLDLSGLLPPGAAVPHLRAGLHLAPGHPDLLTALGVALGETGPMAEAVSCFTAAALLRPQHAAAWANLGKALAAEARFAEAEAAFARARALAPGDAQIAVNRAAALLKAGRLQEGWAAFSARHALPGRPPRLPGRLLDTTEVAGRTVLLTHDEGLGDTLQFIRFATLLAGRGARVLARVPPPLARLVAAVPGIAGLANGPVLPRYDAWCPLLDLPALFGTGLDALPAAPVFHASPRPAPGRRGGFAVGLVWAGDPRGLLDRQRSMAVEALAPLGALAGVRWVSLQHGAPAPGWMEDAMPGVRDLADTAAIIAGLDVVASVDTAVAHLAAGMGKPVLLMDRYDNCWRWLSGREDSPWYPNLRIVRQSAPGDWAGVVDRVAAQVTELVAELAAGRAAISPAAPGGG